MPPQARGRGQSQSSGPIIEETVKPLLQPLGHIDFSSVMTRNAFVKPKRLAHLTNPIPIQNSQLQTDADQRLLLMGVRLYNPGTGRFTAVDPEDGGSDAAYAYPTDPVNSFDLDGKRWNWRKAARVGVIGAGIVGALACGASIVCEIAVGAAAGFGVYAARHAGKRSWRWKKAARATAFGAVSGLGWGGGARAAGMRLVSRREFGVQFTKNRGARGTTFRWKGKKRFGIHSPRIRYKSGRRSRAPIHFHYKNKRGGYKRHRPWQRGFR